MGLFTFWQKDKPPSHSFVPSTPRPTPHIHTGPKLTITQRIQNGAALLDNALPSNWPQAIDPDRLNIASGAHCVLGQIFGTFQKGAMVMHLPLAKGQDLHPANLGFDRDPENHVDPEWKELNEGWRKFLAERVNEQTCQAKDA